MSEADPGYLHILVIDDDANMRQLIAHVLLQAGHQVVAVDSAEAGLEQLPYYKFDVAFLDHHLPGMEGLVLGEYLKANNPRMHIALVTGGADARIARLVEEYGLVLIHKPFELDEILAVVERFQQQEAEQAARGLALADRAFHPDVAGHVAGLGDYFGDFNVPRRLSERIARRVREALDALRFADDMPEADRVAAFAGLLTASVLGIRLPRHKDGETLYAHYDRMMLASGRASAFEEVTKDAE